MRLRQQLPVASPLDARTLARGVASALGAAASADAAAARLCAASGARRALLTDSGTSALVLALRIAAPRGDVAFPAYGCIDLAAAAERAGVRVRLYDVDPVTLSPDLASVERALRAGARGIVVAHLYGFPADVVAVDLLARRYGALLIEDAAQAAGGTLHGRPLGTLGTLVVRSFGRGKGTCAGRGGALLSFAPELDEAMAAARAALAPSARGVGIVVASAAQWVLGRPAIYGLPASIPALRLGEMVYHRAAEPAAMTRAAVAMLGDALDRDAGAVRERRRIAAAYDARLSASRARPVPGGVAGYLRYPVLVTSDAQLAPALGVLRAYPATLDAMAPMRPLLAGDVPAMPGAAQLARSLATLPTHHMVTGADVERIVAHVAGGTTHAPVGHVASSIA